MENDYQQQAGRARARQFGRRPAQFGRRPEDNYADRRGLFGYWAQADRVLNYFM